MDSRSAARSRAEEVAAQRRGEKPTPRVPVGPAFAGGGIPGLGAGATVKIVGDVSQLTPEQRDKLRALGIDLGSLGGQSEE